MLFTQMPQPFASVHRPLTYVFSRIAAPELHLRVLDVRSGALLGSKRFHAVETAAADIAPIVRRALRFRPVPGATGVTRGEDRTVCVQLSGEESFSPVRSFTGAGAAPLPPCLMTTMPLRRVIAYGESDEITCCIPGQHTVTIAGDGSAEPLEFRMAADGRELTLIRVDTRDFAPDTRSISVVVAADGRVVGRIDYTVVASFGAGSVRLAWRSSAGSVEHYTFPVVAGIVRKTVRESLRTDRGKVVASVRSERLVTLRSAIETAAVVEALSEIAAAPQVWRVASDGYEPVELLPEERPQALCSHGTLCCVEIVLRNPSQIRVS
ncbi:MAG: hypothetical protein K2H81_06385 [Alistipes sp.]|nr:hypothetical protein [Alistipes sp.]